MMKDKAKPWWKRGAAFLGVGVVLLVFALYLGTLAPTVLYFEAPTMYDPAMLQAEAYVLGVGHPTGYPIYMMLAHLFTYLPFGDPAYRVNLASAVFGAATVAVVYVIGHRSSGRAVAAATGALAFGLSQTLWSQAVIAEVYTLNALFISLVVLILFVWRDARKDRYLLLAAFVMGLSLTHHLTSGLLVPAGLLFVFLVERRKLHDARLLLKGGALFLLGLVPYLYLPIRAAMDAPLNEADPSTPGRFLVLVTASSYLLKLLTDYAEPQTSETSNQEELLTRLASSAEHLSGQFSLVLVVVGVVGLVYLATTDRAAALFTGVSFTGWLIYALTDGVEDFYVFLIPAYLVFSLWIAVGTGVLLQRAKDLTQRLSARGRLLLIMFSVLALAAPFLGIRETYAMNDRSGDYEGRRIIEAVAQNAAPGATVLHHRSSLWYMVLVEERRRDLTLIDPFNTSWIRYNDIVWPDPLTRTEVNARYKTNDITGVATAREAAKTGPVYVLDPEKANLASFREAGFEVVEVDEGGVLHELVPPGREPYR